MTSLTLKVLSNFYEDSESASENHFHCQSTLMLTTIFKNSANENVFKRLKKMVFQHVSKLRKLCKWQRMFLKFMFSKLATKIDEISTFDLTLCSKRQI